MGLISMTQGGVIMSMMYSEEVDSRGSYHHGDLYRSLLNAALELIEEDGLDGLSLRKMASRCKVSQTAPYRHFASKEHLLAVLAEQGCEDLLQSMKQAQQDQQDTQASLLDSISSLLVAYVGFAREHCSYFQMIFNLRMLDRRHYPSLTKAMAKHRQLIVQMLLHSGYSQEQADYYANHFWAYAHGIATLNINHQWVVADDQILEKQIRQFVAACQLQPCGVTIE